MMIMVSIKKKSGLSISIKVNLISQLKLFENSLHYML